MASNEIVGCEQILREQQEYDESQKRCQAFIVSSRMCVGDLVGKIMFWKIQSECTPNPNARLLCDSSDDVPQCVYIHRSSTRKQSILDRCREHQQHLPSLEYYGSTQFPNVSRSDRY